MFLQKSLRAQILATSSNATEMVTDFQRRLDNGILSTGASGIAAAAKQVIAKILGF